MPPQRPERFQLTENLNISRILTGLWQVADMERSGAPLDPEGSANVLQSYSEAGFDTFDMADHYGSAEIIAGRLLNRYATLGILTAMANMMTPM